MGREVTKEKLQDGAILTDRECTDCLMIIVFGVFVIGWIVVASTAISIGRPSRLLLPENFRGNLCGDVGSALEHYPYLYIPKPSRLSYGLCEPACPSTYDYVCNNDVEPMISNTSAMVPNTYYNHYAVEALEGPSNVAKCVHVCDTATQAAAVRYLGLIQKVDEFKCFLVFYSSGPTLNRCIPYQANNENATLAADAGESLSALDSLSETIGVAQFFQRGFAETEQCWIVIAICSLTAVIISLIWIFLLRFILAPLVYLCILLILALLIAIGYFAYYMANQLEDERLPGDTATQNQIDTWRAIQYAFWIGAGIYFVAMIWLLKRIRIAIAIMKEGSKAFLSAPGLAIIPPIVMLLVFGLIALFVVIAIYIQTMGSATYSDFVAGAKNTFGNSTVTSVLAAANKSKALAAHYNFTNATNTTQNTTQWTTSQAIKYLHAYNFFGFLWVSNLCMMFGFFVMAMTTCVWYFSATAVEMDHYENGDAQQKESGRLKSTPLGTALKAFIIAIRYHFGTILWGSLLIAIIQFIRAVFLYVQEEFLDKWKDNTSVKIVVYCIDCCLAYIERVIRIISKTAFVITIIKNTSFCASARETMALLVANAVRVSTLSFMSAVACFVLKLFIVGCNMIVAYILIHTVSLTQNKKIESGLFPMVGIFFISFIVAALFINVYESCTETVMICFLIDDSELSGAFMPKSLATLLNQFGEVEKARKDFENKLHEATDDVKKEVEPSQSAHPPTEKKK